MKKNSFLYRIFDLYYDGFTHMTIGKTLWTIILIKLFIIFVILKIFFFPDFLSEKSKGSKQDVYVTKELIQRATNN